MPGTESAELFYTTEVGVDETKAASITGLNIAAGESFTITWVSDRGLPTGSSRRIGLADVFVTTSEIVDPVIDVVGSLTSFSAIEGIPSASQPGSALNGDIAVTAPADYEVSTDDSTYGSSVTLPASAVIVPATTVYVRIAATAPLGNPSGLVTIASNGAKYRSDRHGERRTRAKMLGPRATDSILPPMARRLQIPTAVEVPAAGRKSELLAGLAGRGRGDRSVRFPR